MTICESSGLIGADFRFLSDCLLIIPLIMVTFFLITPSSGNNSSDPTQHTLYPRVYIQRLDTSSDNHSLLWILDDGE